MHSRIFCIKDKENFIELPDDVEDVIDNLKPNIMDYISSNTNLQYDIEDLKNCLENILVFEDENKISLNMGNTKSYFKSKINNLKEAIKTIDLDKNDSNLTLLELSNIIIDKYDFYIYDIAYEALYPITEWLYRQLNTKEHNKYVILKSFDYHF